MNTHISHTHISLELFSVINNSINITENEYELLNLPAELLFLVLQNLNESFVLLTAGINDFLLSSVVYKPM